MNNIDKFIIKTLLYICRILGRYSENAYNFEIKEIINDFEVIKDD